MREIDRCLLLTCLLLDRPHDRGQAHPVYIQEEWNTAGHFCERLRASDEVLDLLRRGATALGLL